MEKVEKEIMIVPIELIPENMDIETFVKRWTEFKDYPGIMVIKVDSSEGEQ